MEDTKANSMFSTSIIDYPILTGFPVPIRYLLRGRNQEIHMQLEVLGDSTTTIGLIQNILWE